MATGRVQGRAPLAHIAIVVRTCSAVVELSSVRCPCISLPGSNVRPQQIHSAPSSRHARPWRCRPASWTEIEQLSDSYFNHTRVQKALVTSDAEPCRA